MKKYLIILTLCFTSVFAQEKFELNKTYNLKDIEIKQNSVFYPVYKFMKAFKDNKPHEALDYCTEEILYKKDSYSANFYDRCVRAFKYFDYTQKSKIEINFYKKEDYDKVLITFNEKLPTGVPSFCTFRVKKINGKYMVYYIGSAI